MRIHPSVRSLLFLIAILATPATSLAQFGVPIRIAPPPLVAYSQPICPQEGYLWTPGYWAYGTDGYFWVPGTWVEPPGVGLLWTPGYWGWSNDAYFWNVGYWGPTVGFYGGINYGYGYGGFGYDGGYWRNNQFSYNRSVNNVNVTNFHNTYERTVSNGRAGNNVSYNGGTGGTIARATAAEETAARERHTPATTAQTGHQNDYASANHELLASVNHGKPPVAATSEPGEFTGKSVVAAEGSSAVESKATAARASIAVHPKDLPPIERLAAPNTGNSKLDQKYQTQQDKLITKQNQDRQKLQQKQDNEHQQLAKQNASEARNQQTEQKHQQQTQQLQQRHTQQAQQMQARQQPAGGSESHGGGQHH
jgi:WXXGXW repeat (2 copies)